GWDWVGTPAWDGAAMGVDKDLPFLPPGTAALHMSGSGTPVDGTAGAVGLYTSVRIPVEGGGRYIPSAYLASEGCKVRLEYRTYGANGLLLDQDVVGFTTGVPDSANLIDWPRVFSVLVLPVGAVEMELQVWAGEVTSSAPRAW